MSNVISKIKMYSCIKFPILIISISYSFKSIKSFVLNNITGKLDTLAGCTATLIGFMLTTLTIYLSFPKNEDIVRRMKNSGHNFILMSNNIASIIFYTASLLIWLLFNDGYLNVVLFLCAVSNAIIVMYYIAALSIIERRH